MNRSDLVWHHNAGPMIPAIVRRDLETRGLRIGAPKERDGYTATMLRRMGIVGIYGPEAASEIG